MMRRVRNFTFVLMVVCAGFAFHARPQAAANPCFQDCNSYCGGENYGYCWTGEPCFDEGYCYCTCGVCLPNGAC